MIKILSVQRTYTVGIIMKISVNGKEFVRVSKDGILLWWKDVKDGIYMNEMQATELDGICKAEILTCNTPVLSPIQ